jgi:tetratricopeptide (TPR) repeat protein
MINYKKTSAQKAIELMNEAESIFHEKNYPLSIKYYSQAIPKINSPTNLAYALYMRGRAYDKTGCANEAAKDWKEAQRLGFELPIETVY